MKCPNCGAELECATDIDHSFSSENSRWFCTLVSYFCLRCEYMEVEIEPIFHAFKRISATAEWEKEGTKE